jgi:hypothetical protein
MTADEHRAIVDAITTERMQATALLARAAEEYKILCALLNAKDGR